MVSLSLKKSCHRCHIRLRHLSIPLPPSYNINSSKESPIFTAFACQSLPLQSAFHVHHSTETALARVTRGRHVAQPTGHLSDLILLILSEFHMVISFSFLNIPHSPSKMLFILPWYNRILTGHSSRLPYWILLNLLTSKRRLPGLGTQPSLSCPHSLPKRSQPTPRL